MRLLILLLLVKCQYMGIVSGMRSLVTRYLDTGIDIGTYLHRFLAIGVGFCKQSLMHSMAGLPSVLAS